jgi:hemerythrin
MELITWTDALSVGVQEVDDQHKLLLRLVSDVAEVVQGDYDQEAAGKALRRLCDYTVEHFASEEALMDMDTYAEYDVHLSAHMDCTTKALDFLQAFSAGEEVNLTEFLQFVSDWVHEHIMQMDQTLGAFLNQRGQAAEA